MSGPPTWTPKSAVGRWFESRLPIGGLVYSSFVAYPTPRNLNYFWAFGAILAFMLVAQILTGVVLAMHYTAHTSMAFTSVEHIMRDVDYGWLLRYLHSNGASMFFLAVYIHMFKAIYYGSYKAPREVLWILGVIIFLLMMAAGFMGYVLPWGQMSFWGATVITNLFSAIPVIGENIVTYLWGGYSVDNPTLNRFFSLHYLLPFMLAGVVVLHVWALHVTGQNNPTGVEVQSTKDTVRFTPYATLKDLFGLSVFLILYLWFVFYIPNYLGHSDNYIEANPGVTPAHIVPEWYFLPYYAILRGVPSKLGGVLLMFGSIGILAFMPWLDTSKVRSAVYRPLFKQFTIIFALVVIGLGYLGAMPAEGGYVIAARILTFLYFAYFLIVLPVLGLVEKTRPLPPSIADAVLTRSRGSAPVGVGAAASPQAKG
jgi:ubiquinol-cytochrome c reductase cytochrome b/c1 subunit